MPGRNLTRIPCALALTGAFVSLGALTSVGVSAAPVSPTAVGGLVSSPTVAHQGSPVARAAAASAWAAPLATQSSGPKAQAAACITQTGESPGMLATFRSCEGRVYVDWTTYNTFSLDQFYNILVTHHNIAYGQRAKSSVPILSHQVEEPFCGHCGGGTANTEPKHPRRVFTTRPITHGPAWAHFRVQPCEKRFLASSKCGAWGPIVTVYLGQNELTAY